MHLQPSEMMEFNAQTMVFLQRHLVLSILNGRQHHLDPVTINSDFEQIHREATAQTYSTSVDDVNKSVEENDESDLTELDFEEGEGLEEYKDVDKEEEEEEEEDDVEEEANGEEELVSNQDMEHSVIVVAPRR